MAEELARFLYFKYPDKEMDSSRWGFRLQGVVGPNLNLSVGHYRTFLDLPAMRAVVEPGIPLLTSLDQMAFEVSWQPVHITGGSLNYWEPRTNMFFLSLQYFGQWILDYDERMRQALQLYPSPVNFSALKETESVFTALVNTMYRKGTINPQLALACDVRGAWLIQPSVNLIREPFRFMIQYSAIQGNFTNFGAFRDRDQITFILSYLLN